MSILSEAGRTAAAVPSCPAWCEFPPDHDLPEIDVERLAVLRREHSRVVLDGRGLAWIELFRLDLSLGVDGPTVVGPNLVEVTSVGDDLSPAQARALAAALLDAADALDAPRGGAR